MNKVKYYASYLDINLDAIQHNCRICANKFRVPIMAVVKADAYGFGALPVAKACAEAGVESFAVARIQEGIELREGGIRQDILVFSLQDEDEMQAAVRYGLTISLNRFDQIEPIAKLKRESGISPKAHLKIDTGMSRFGFLPEELPELIRIFRENQINEIEGIYSHYANIDDDPKDPLNSIQKQRFDCALKLLNQAGIQPRWIHFTNSAAAFSNPDSRYTMVRLGNGLLGVNPFYYEEAPDFLMKALSWKSRLISVRRIPAGHGVGYAQHTFLSEDSLIGVVPVGYGDGYHQAEGNKMLIHGQWVPVIGRVCADVSMVKLPEYYEVGEEVVLIGKQGEKEISIEELAKLWHITRAAVTCGISSRVERRYQKSG